MPRKDKRSQQARRKAVADRREQKSMAASSLAQQLRPVPTIPDVQRLSVRNLRVHTIQRAYAVTLDFSTTPNAGLSFDVTSLADYANLDGLFDQFRIAQVNVKFFPKTLTSTVVTAIDYNDATSTAFANLLDFETAQIIPVGASYWERTFNPMALAAADGVSFGSANQSNRQWSDLTEPPLWYGLKVASLAVIADPINVFVTLMLNFRSSD